LGDKILELKKYGQFIKNLREKYNLTQDGLAEILLTSHQTISYWEKGKTVPSLDSLSIIEIKFPNEFSIFMSDKKIELHDDNSAYLKQRITNALLKCLTTESINDTSLEDVANESGIDIKTIHQYFSDTKDILLYLANEIDQEVQFAAEMNQTLFNSPFELITHNILPVLYSHRDKLKVLYSGDYAGGIWMEFLEAKYTKWTEPFFENYSQRNSNITKSFAISLTVKWSLALVSTWMTQTVPEELESYQKTFIDLTKISLDQIIKS
jgi:transcriptional regulator with XRE-family HTH domain